jgi:hypothetical protein
MVRDENNGGVMARTEYPLGQVLMEYIENVPISFYHFTIRLIIWKPDDRDFDIDLITSNDVSANPKLFTLGDILVI